MLRSKRRTIPVAIAFVSAIPAACVGNTDPDDSRVATSELSTDAGNAADPGSAEVTVCHMPPGNPANMLLITVSASAAPALQAQGDGVCASGATDCCLESGPASVCTNLSADPNNCRACGNACPTPSAGTGAATCTAGVCGLTCTNPTSSLCGTACVNEHFDTKNCGGCGNVCPGPTSGTGFPACINGTCLLNCFGTQCGTACVNLNTDSNNCGACGNVCAAGTSCCGGTCVNESTDLNNCGACGNACITANGLVCSAGTCVCPSGVTQCGNACINPATNHLDTLPPTPFVPLSGSASIAGTEGLPTGLQVPPLSACRTFVASPASGSLTFSLTANSCSFNYIGSDRGFSSNMNTSMNNGSNFPVAVSFDGDNYTCTFQENGSTFPSQIYEACPEFQGHMNGLFANVTFTVTRSTGAVSLVRNCVYGDATCSSTSVGLAPLSTEFNLTGSLSCSAGG